MGHWNWINGVYNLEQAADKIDELNEEISTLRRRLRESEKCIIGMMEFHIGKSGDGKWRETYYSPDRNCIKYEEKYQLITRKNLEDICE